MKISFSNCGLEAGLHFENGARQASATIDYSHMNVANHLIRLSWFNDIILSVLLISPFLKKVLIFPLINFLEQSGPVIESRWKYYGPNMIHFPFPCRLHFLINKASKSHIKFIQPILGSQLLIILFVLKASLSFVSSQVWISLGLFEYRDPLVPIFFLTSDGSDSPSFTFYLFQNYIRRTMIPSQQQVLT